MTQNPKDWNDRFQELVDSGRFEEDALNLCVVEAQQQTAQEIFKEIDKLALSNGSVYMSKHKIKEIKQIFR